MSIYDQNLPKKGVSYRCGKCNGTDHYIGAQTMSQGQKNWITKTVQVPMCRTCDIQMVTTVTRSTTSKILGVVIIVIFVVVVVGVATALAIG